MQIGIRKSVGRQVVRLPVGKLTRTGANSLRSCVIAFAIAVSAISVQASSAADYILGPQDKLKIRVFEWRPVTGTAFEWVPLNGEFVISAGGTLSLPLIGAVRAAGSTADQLAETIGTRLQAETGLQKRPNASVEVSEFRPFFVTGLVAKPGKYSYLPGLTAIQAISIAGGTFGSVDPSLQGLQREALVNRGDLRTLEVERLGLLARQARLDAIIQGQASITFPADLTSRAGLPVADRMMREERSLFEARQKSLDSAIESLKQAKTLATNEIQTLDAKATSLARQIDLATKDLGTVSKLTAEGLSLTARKTGAAENVADLEGRKLDVSMAMLRAQQDVVKADSDATDLRNRYRVEALNETADVRAKLAANRERADTAKALLESIETNAPSAAGAADDSRSAIVLSVIRVVDGKVQTLPVGENDAIIPGDVVRVERKPTTTTGMVETGVVAVTR